jgi:hypothetical protein
VEVPATRVAPLEARERVVPETVISLPGERVWVPTTKAELKFAVTVVPPMVATMGEEEVGAGGLTAAGELEAVCVPGSPTTGEVDSVTETGSAGAEEDPGGLAGSDDDTGATTGEVLIGWTFGVVLVAVLGSTPVVGGGTGGVEVGVSGGTTLECVDMGAAGLLVVMP